MKRPIILSSLVIVVAALLLCGGTYAYFSDTAFSDSNTFNAGMIDLKIKDNDEAWGDTVSATWTSTNMKPGDELPFPIPQLEFRNTGSVAGSTVDISASNTVPGATGTPAEDLDRFMQITRMDYSDTIPTVNLLDYLADYNGNGWKDLDDLEHLGPSGETAITGVSAPVGTGTCSLDLRFRPEAGNAFQGLTLVTGLTLTLIQ